MASIQRSGLGALLRVGHAHQGLCASWTLAHARGIGTDSSGETHDDFKPKYKAQPVNDVENTIKGDISSHKVFIYMKGVPEAPMCGFSNMACRILDAYGLQYGSRNVLADEGIREGIKSFTGWPTIPQVFVNGEFVGGSDILHDMHKNGELEKLVEELATQTKK